MQPNETIHSFVCELLVGKGDTEPLSDDESLFLSGRLQSADIVELAVFFEEKFGADFSRMGFDQGIMDSVNAMAVLLGDSGSST